MMPWATMLTQSYVYIFMMTPVEASAVLDLRTGHDWRVEHELQIVTE